MQYKIAAVLGLTAACLAWVLWGLDLSVVGERIAGFRWSTVLVMWGWYGAAHLCRVQRLAVLLDQPVPFWRLLSINTVGFLAINVFPLRLGEWVRPYLLLEREKVPFGVSLSAIFVERMLDFVMLLLMLLAAGTVDLPVGVMEVFGLDVVAAGQRMAATAVGAGLVFGALVIGVGDPFIGLLERLLPRDSRYTAAFTGFLKGFRSRMRELSGRPARLLWAFLLSVAVWGFTLAAIRSVFQGTGLEGLDWQATLVTWSITLSAMTVLPTPGFLGAFEAAFSGSLRILGVDADNAVTLSFMVHLGQLAFSVGLGSLFLAAEGWSLLDLVRRARRHTSTHPER